MRIGIVLIAILSIIFWGFWNPIFGRTFTEWPSLALEKDNVLEIVFSDSIDTTSLSDSTIVVSQSEDGSNPILVTILPGVTPETIRILPQGGTWPEGKTLFLLLTQNIYSQAGGKLETPVRLRFQIATTQVREILRIMNEFLPMLDPSGPSEPSVFTIDTPHRITRIATFHFPPPQTVGTISLKGNDGIIYGPWQAEGKTGPGGFANTFWEVTPNVTLLPGTYQVMVSHPETWSFNEASGKRGLVIVEGYAISEASNRGKIEEVTHREILHATSQALLARDFDSFHQFLTRDLQRGFSGPSKVGDEESQEVTPTLEPWQWTKGRSEITANAVTRDDTVEGPRYLAEHTSTRTGKKERNP
ncbi:MAG: hypothetical protein HPY68_08340 [Candidatus Atribacteria bacterium]|nr:hypothetical protein [Candidatus Atribacteria bacterium]